MKQKTKTPPQKLAEIAKLCETMTRAEVAEKLGLERKQVHNLMQRWMRYNKSKIANNEAPKAIKTPIKIINVENEIPASSGKAMVIITTDINMIKKLIGEL